MAKTKSVDGEDLPASAFLVVPDLDKPSEWALPVRDASGKADHARMGAAFAALTSNHRGQPYSGPGKAEALAKLKALYRSEGMPLPDAKMSDDATFTTDFAAPVTEDRDDVVIRTGKLFEAGDYPDKAFSFDSDDLANAVATFEPCEVDLEHTSTLLDGKLGTVQRIFAGEDGTSLMGEVHLPKWLDSLLDEGERKVSATWDRTSKRLMGLALVRNPRVSDAALLSAFSASEFAGTRHDTPSGQMAMQRIHTAAVQGGAVCKRTAQMASRHEMTAIQQVHDTAVSHGAQCESVGATQAGYPLFSDTQSPSKPTRSIRMNIREWLTGKAKEDGIEIDEKDLEAAFSTAPSQDVIDLKEARAKLEAENAALKAEQERQSAEFARLAAERRTADAVAFAQSVVSAHKMTPGAAEKLAVLAARVAESDSRVTFAEGEKSMGALLQELCEALPDFSLFTRPQIDPGEVAALFNQTTTPGLAGKDAPPTEARIAELLKLTPDGAAIIAERNGAKH
jgi:hypothetical protein